MSVKSQFVCKLCKTMVAYDPEQLTPDEFEMCSDCINNIKLEIKQNINLYPKLGKDFNKNFNLLFK